MRLQNFTLPVDANQKDIGQAYADLNTLYAYNASGNLQYLGKAIPGTASNTTGWQIRQYFYQPTDTVTAIMFASGSMDFEFDWASAATFSYL